MHDFPVAMELYVPAQLPYTCACTIGWYLGEVGCWHPSGRQLSSGQFGLPWTACLAYSFPLGLRKAKEDMQLTCDR